MSVKNKPLISQGFDRNVDYLTMKKSFIDAYNEYYDHYFEKFDSTKVKDPTSFNPGRDLNKLIYVIISMIQLRNGSRISEAVKAFIQFLSTNSFDLKEDISSILSKKVIVKISKSEKKFYDKNTHRVKTTKPRFRKMMFPYHWIQHKPLENPFKIDEDDKRNKADFTSLLIRISQGYDQFKLKKNVLDYLLKYHKCNTHSLRYAFINYMIYDKKNDISSVAKFVGHANLNQIVRYTQQKNSDKLFDIDM